MHLFAAGLLFNSELSKLHWELSGSECNPLSIKQPEIESTLRVQCSFPRVVQQAAPQPKTKLQSVPLKPSLNPSFNPSANSASRIGNASGSIIFTSCFTDAAQRHQLQLGDLSGRRHDNGVACSVGVASALAALQRWLVANGGPVPHGTTHSPRQGMSARNARRFVFCFTPPHRLHSLVHGHTHPRRRIVRGRACRTR
jgi:hypothetical protein